MSYPAGGPRGPGPTRCLRSVPHRRSPGAQGPRRSANRRPRLPAHRPGDVEPTDLQLPSLLRAGPRTRPQLPLPDTPAEPLTDLEAGKRSYPPCDPRLMVRLLIYGYITGVRPSRAIERRCVDDVAFRLLSADQAPDTRSIARFRRRHLDALADLFCLRRARIQAASRAGFQVSPGVELRCEQGPDDLGGAPSLGLRGRDNSRPSPGGCFESGTLQAAFAVASDTPRWHHRVGAPRSRPLKIKKRHANKVTDGRKTQQAVSISTATSRSEPPRTAKIHNWPHLC